MSGFKRRRKDSNSRENTESESTAGDSTKIHRDAEFWFEDGSIILIAGDVEFRIFKGILADYSPVFRDMFSLPQPSSQGTPTATAACPIVHLSDSPEDLRHVLRVFGPFTQQARPSFHMISAVIRLGHKYQMENIVTEGVNYLKRWFTSDFTAWSAGALYEPDAPLECEHAIGVVNLARLVDAPSLLPTALLMCCGLAGQAVTGFAREDGSRETLAPDDLARCFKAHSRLAQHMLVLTIRIFAPSVLEECEYPQKCLEVLQAMLLGVENEPEHFAYSDVFVSWMELFERPGGLWFECCTDCQEMLKRRDRDERFEVWKELPGIMGVRVEGWAAST
ncbi:uncharacterized protein TRAVEDRAFT_128265 [Trametes versicolor FP-101664 SS1]|uniref:uncharacterized protein n=1 Tax=Trametes versicolor (strain FP-101664) TaxID=717944 RepID=UPI0004622D3A|nr:uncharacterized protein TRAVEDRAFT_128265 [Trametes versicolor FP-101664 SS1]EIW56891.1 hypothetical protein TRAVEDRAFT_128265 [Trametes versicolor FP-101664 SS1]